MVCYGINKSQHLFYPRQKALSLYSCRNRNDKFEWESDPGTGKDSDVFTNVPYFIADQNPLQDCAGDEVKISLSAKEWPANTWKIQSLALKLSYTTGPGDEIRSRTFQDCPGAGPYEVETTGQPAVPIKLCSTTGE